jgi:hypothetical protein
MKDYLQSAYSLAFNSFAPCLSSPRIIHDTNVFEASVIWDGQIIPIEINESETDPLVGMGLLEGYE